MMIPLSKCHSFYKSYGLSCTEKSWHKTDAVGKHGALDDVQVRKDDEDEDSESNSMQRLAEEHGKELLGAGFGAGLEETDPHGTYECSYFRYQVRYQEAPHPGDALHFRQLRHKLLLPACRNIHCLKELRDGLWDCLISLESEYLACSEIDTMQSP